MSASREHLDVPEAERPINGQVPFVEQLIPQLEKGISFPLEQAIENKSREHERSFLATQITRGIDLSGLVPNVADVCSNKKEAQGILIPLASAKLAAISRLKPKDQEAIFQTLHNQSCTPDALVMLDEMFEKMIDTLKLQRGEKSETLRLINRDLIWHYDVKIAYYPVFTQDQTLDYINHIYVIPPPSPEMHKILDPITPDFLNRRNNIKFDVTTPEGFLQQIGIVGHPFTRELAKYIRTTLILAKANETQKNDLLPYLEFIQNNP